MEKKRKRLGGLDPRPRETWLTWVSVDKQLTEPLRVPKTGVPSPECRDYVPRGESKNRSRKKDETRKRVLLLSVRKGRNEGEGVEGMCLETGGTELWETTCRLLLNF